MDKALTHECNTPQTALHPLAKPYQTFVKEANHKHNNAYTYCQSCYKGTNSLVTITCPQHGVFTLQGTIHLRQTGCPDCAYEKGQLLNLPYLKFIELLEKEYPGKYLIKEEDYNIGKNSTIYCLEHQQYFKKMPHYILKRGQGCKQCGKDNKSIPYIELVKDFRKTYKGFYTYPKTQEYKSLSSEITIFCPQHNSFTLTAKSHRNGIGCPQCSQENKREKLSTPYTEFLEKVHKVHNSFYTYNKKDYISLHKKMKINCPDHGVFFMTPYKHLIGQKCVKCSRRMSEGEKNIALILEKNNIEYSREKTFRTLTTELKGKPRFDFCIPSKNVLIEYDGRGHREPIQIFGISQVDALHSFERTKKNDKLKDQWAKNNGWTLLRYESINSVHEKLIKDLGIDSSNRES